MKTLHLSITTISISLLLIILLHPVQAQSIPLDQKNATLILNFTSEFDGYEGGPVAFSHNDDMFVYPSILKNPKFGWTSQLWLYYLKNDTNKLIDFNDSLSRVMRGQSMGFYESFIGEFRFSSDDKELLFVGNSCDGSQSHTTFYIIDLQNPILQCNSLTNVISADWMPDGSIALAQNNEKNDTVSIYQNGAEKLLYTKPITPPDDSLNSTHITSIKTSHDGTKIALWYSIRFYHETQILDVNKGKITNTFAGGHPRWSQDDKMLLYSFPTSAGHYTNGPLKPRTYVNLLDVNNNKTTNIDTVNMGINDLELSHDSKTVFYVMRIPYPYDFLNFTSGIYKIELNHDIDSQSTLTHVETPLQQFKSGILASDIKCADGFTLVIKSEDNSPACVKPQTAQKLIERGWAKSQDNGSFVTLTEGQREGSLLVQKIFADNVQGMNFREYPVATNIGFPVTLHIGDIASNGCTVMLTLVKIENGTATFLKKEDHSRPCPICLSENTLIDTPNGPVNVKMLKVGMMVFTLDSYSHKQAVTILKTGRTLAPQGHLMVHLVLNDKRELYVSPNHPTFDGRHFGNLSIGGTLDGSTITSAGLVPYNGTYTYDILPSGQTGAYWANGILVGSTLK